MGWNYWNSAVDAVFTGGLWSAIKGLNNASDAKRQTERKKNQGKIQGDGRSNLPEWLQQYANMGTDANGNITSKAIGNGAGYSNTQLMDMQYNHDEAQLDRDWNEQMYLKYQSPEAQMRQYQEAGLNPALMYEGGVDINGPSASASASTSSSQAGEGPQAGFERVMGVMSTLMQLMSGSGQIASTIQGINSQKIANQNSINATNAEVDYKTALKENLQHDTNIKIYKEEQERVNAKYAETLKKLEVEEFRAKIDNIYEQNKEIASRINVNNSIIEVNGHQIELIDAQTVTEGKEALLKMAQTTLTNLQSEETRKILPYVQAREEAQLRLTYATTETEKAQAQKALEEANLTLVEASKQQKLIDAGYCEETIKGMKKDRVTGYINCIAGNVANIANATANVVSSLKPSVTISTSPIVSKEGKPYLVDSNGQHYTSSGSILK